MADTMNRTRRKLRQEAAEDDDSKRRYQPTGLRHGRAPEGASLAKTRLEGNQSVTLPVKFEPRFWNSCDMRIAVAKQIKRRYLALKEDVDPDCSVQKDALIQRCAFVMTILETREVEAAEGAGLDFGAYVQQVNCLIGLCRVLGLNRHAKSVTDLKSYLHEKRKKRANGD